MSSKIQLRMAGEKIAALMGKSKEKIGVLTIIHNEPRVTLKVSMTDGYITDIPIDNLCCKELSEYYPWIKTMCVTGGGLDEPPIDKTYYVKSNNPRMIEVTICEYVAGTPYTRTYTMSIEKPPSPVRASDVAHNIVPSVTLPIMLDSEVSDYDYHYNNYMYEQSETTSQDILKNIINIKPPKLTRATHYNPVDVISVAEEDM